MLVFIFIIIVIFYVNMFLFKIQNELLYKLLYTIVLWFSLSFFYYNYIEDLLYYLSQVLNEYLIIKDFQDIITIYMQITFLLATLWSLVYFSVIYILWKWCLTYSTEKRTYNIFLLIHLLIVVFWIVKQDLFFSNWEVFLLSAKKLVFDVQPDFYIFFQTLIDDLIDFFIVTSTLYIYYYLFFVKKKLINLVKIQNVRYIFFSFLFIYFVYFFSCETWINFFSFAIISLILTELLMYTKFVLIELKKLIIKSKYL